MDRCVTLVFLALSTCSWTPLEAAELRCPKDAPVDVIFQSSIGAVNFPHELHVDMELPCEECHHETLAGSLAMPHPEYFEDFWIRCETCHHGAAEPGCPKTCSACHHGSPVTIADETLSAKVVIHKSCWGCHPIDTGSDASRGCTSCHQAGARSQSS